MYIFLFFSGFVQDNFLLIDTNNLFQFDVSKKAMSTIPVKQQNTTMRWMKYNPIDMKIYWINSDHIVQRSNLNGTNQELTDTTQGKLFTTRTLSIVTVYRVHTITWSELRYFVGSRQTDCCQILILLYSPSRQNV